MEGYLSSNSSGLTYGLSILFIQHSQISDVFHTKVGSLNRNDQLVQTGKNLKQIQTKFNGLNKKQNNKCNDDIYLIWYLFV